MRLACLASLMAKSLAASKQQPFKPLPRMVVAFVTAQLKVRAAAARTRGGAAPGAEWGGGKEWGEVGAEDSSTGRGGGKACILCGWVGSWLSTPRRRALYASAPACGWTGGGGGRFGRAGGGAYPQVAIMCNHVAWHVHGTPR